MKKKLTRAEKNELTRKNLFDAAVKVVGQAGYRDASITDITAKAHIAQGTFYNYFESRQDILDHLLPELGQELLEFLGAQVGDATSLEREEKSIRAYFQFIRNKPEFYRILMEAPIYSPQSFETHADNLVSNYEAALRRTREKGFLQDYSEDEFEAIALILLGARVYLSRQYCFRNGKVAVVPEQVVQTYMKLVSGGLYRASASSGQGRRGKASVQAKPAYDCEVTASGTVDFAATYTLSQALAEMGQAAADCLVQQILSDFTRRATESLLSADAAIVSTTTHMSRHRPALAIHASCKHEQLSDGEGILHIRLSDDERDVHSHVASCQVIFAATNRDNVPPG